MVTTPDIEWTTIAGFFEPDGSLRDVYVHPATPGAWRTLRPYLRSQYSPVFFTLDGIPAFEPELLDNPFSAKPHHKPRLNFRVGGIDIACHFFSDVEIEFDFLPQEVTGSNELRALRRFQTS